MRMSLLPCFVVSVLHDVGADLLQREPDLKHEIGLPAIGHRQDVDCRVNALDFVQRRFQIECKGRAHFPVLARLVVCRFAPDSLAGLAGPGAYCRVAPKAPTMSDCSNMPAASACPVP